MEKKKAESLPHGTYTLVRKIGNIQDMCMINGNKEKEKT